MMAWIGGQDKMDTIYLGAGQAWRAGPGEASGQQESGWVVALAPGWRACGPQASSHHAVQGDPAIWGGEPACPPTWAPLSQCLQPTLQNNLSCPPGSTPAQPVPSF